MINEKASFIKFIDLSLLADDEWGDRFIGEASNFKEVWTSNND